MYILDNACNAYNVGKRWGKARGTEAGTVRGWKSRKLGLDGSRFFFIFSLPGLPKTTDYPGLPRTTQNYPGTGQTSCAKHYGQLC